VEHYDVLLNRDSVVEEEAVQRLAQKGEIGAMGGDITFEEMKKAVSQMKNGKAAGVDGIPAEVWKFGGEGVLRVLHSFCEKVWREEVSPQDWKDAMVCSLYKSKGDRSECGNYRGISLLSTAGKAMARVLTNRLMDEGYHLIPESQCGFRRGRSTVDMMFCARQVQEKCIEQRVGMHAVFIDLTKAYDTVNREGLWLVLRKFGFPEKMVSVIRSLHEGTRAAVVMSGGQSEWFEIRNGLRQGCVLAPNLFSLFIAAVMLEAFEGLEIAEGEGVYVKYRADGKHKLMNVTGLAARTKTAKALVLDMMFADDMKIVCHTVEALQRACDLLAGAVKAYGLIISLPKTEVLSSSPGPVCITIEGTQLKRVDEFTYLGGKMCTDGALDKEVLCRLQKANATFGRLWHRVWSQSDIRLPTKLALYRATVVTTVLYGCQTWATKRYHLAKLEAFRLRCQRKILGLRWQDLVPNVAVVEKTGLESLEVTIRRARLSWVGHITRMGDERLPKRLLYGELGVGTRRQGGPRQRYKDVVCADAKAFGFKAGWEQRECKDRDRWRAKLKRGREVLQLRLNREAVEKRKGRKEKEAQQGVARLRAHRSERVARGMDGRKLP
jgi:hypothetical protein